MLRECRSTGNQVVHQLILVINRGYFRAGDPAAESVLKSPHAMITHLMDVDLFRTVIDSGHYRGYPIVFDDGSRFFVFERK